MKIGDLVLEKGDKLSIDGSTGEVLLGEVPTVLPKVTGREWGRMGSFSVFPVSDLKRLGCGVAGNSIYPKEFSHSLLLCSQALYRYILQYTYFLCVIFAQCRCQQCPSSELKDGDKFIDVDTIMSDTHPVLVRFGELLSCRQSPVTGRWQGGNPCTPKQIMKAYQVSILLPWAS